MVSFQEADFFALTVPQHERFDLIYDHTSVDERFLVAAEQESPP